MAGAPQSPTIPRRQRNPRVPEKADGHRRKPIRRSVVARSNTMPVLQSPNPAVTGCPGRSALPTGVAACAQIPFSSPASTKTTFATTNPPSSTPTTPVDARKKLHGLFERVKSKSQTADCPADEASPLPPLTPKAAAVLGLTITGGNSQLPFRVFSYDSSESEDDIVGQTQTDGSEDAGRLGSTVRLPMLRKRASESMLIAHKVTARVQTKIKDQPSNHTELPLISPLTSFRKRTKKSFRIHLPSFHPRGKMAPQPDELSHQSMSCPVEEQTDGYYSDSDLPPSRRRSRRARMKPKQLQIMSPITETSLSEGSIVIEQDDTVLDDLYTAYGRHRLSYGASSMARSLTAPNLQQPQYESDDEPFDANEEKGERTQPEMVQRYGPIFGAVPNYSLNRRHPPIGILDVQSPLQKVENSFLDRAEKRMWPQPIIYAPCDDEKDHDIAKKLKQETRNSLNMAKEKIYLDAEIFKLQQNQNKMKKELRNINTSSRVLQCPMSNSTSSDDDELISIRSSIDTDEEPKLCQAIEITVLAKGPAKAVGMPSRPDKNTVTPDRIKYEVQFTRSDRHHKQCSAEEKEQDSSLAVTVGIDSSATSTPAPTKDNGQKQLEPISPRSGSRRVRSPPHKKGMPAEEVLHNVQKWIDQNSHLEQCPISVSLDPDVVAERRAPPAPVLKDGPYPRPKCQSAPTSPGNPLCAPSIPRKSPLRNATLAPTKPPRYHCVHHGHEFCRIELRKVPDKVAIGPLGTRPFLHTAGGVRQHVCVPVKCEKCGKDVDEVIWECEIPVCHAALCFRCAVEWQADAERRNIDRWKEWVGQGG